MSRRQTNFDAVGPERKGETNVTIDQIVAALVVATVFISPFIALALAALRFGVDSRPGIEDADRRPWLMPTP